MPLQNITDPSAVHRAIEEFKAVGQRQFLERYGFGASRGWMLRVDGQDYDAKAILGAAHGYEHPALGPLPQSQFRGGETTALKLRELGFVVIEPTASNIEEEEQLVPVPGVATSVTIPDDQVEMLIKHFGDESFTTLDFINILRTRYHKTWAALESEYGAGGKGAGKHYSAFSRTSQVLNSWAKRGQLIKNDYEKAPKGYGSPVIRRWNDSSEPRGPVFTTDVDEEHWEGAVRQVLVNRYERDASARRKCIQHYGLACQACDFDFEERYGELGADFIHVHHRIPIFTVGATYKLDPIKDLVPVCPNCHAMLHRNQTKMLTVEELQTLLRKP